MESSPNEIHHYNNYQSAYFFLDKQKMRFLYQSKLFLHESHGRFLLLARLGLLWPLPDNLSSTNPHTILIHSHANHTSQKYWAFNYHHLQVSQNHNLRLRPLSHPQKNTLLWCLPYMHTPTPPPLVTYNHHSNWHSTF